MRKPLVSVVVATYRQDTSFKQAILSLLQQTYRPLEVVIVDDNADANWNMAVEHILNSLSPTFEEVGIVWKYIRNQTNKGSAETRNVGIQQSSGSYVSFLDDDDYYSPEKIQHQIVSMQRANADFGITDIRFVNDHGKQIEYRSRSYLLDNKRSSYLALHLMHHMSGTDTLMFRKAYLLSIGGFPPIDLGDEFYLMLQAILAGGTLCYLPECGVTACVHEGEVGLSSGRNKLRCENSLHEVKKKYFSYLTKKEIKYINMRHYAVIAFAEIRMKHKKAFVKAGIHSFMSSPIDCFRLLMKRKLSK